MTLDDEQIEKQIHEHLYEIDKHEQALRRLYNQNRITVSVTDRRYLNLQIIADSIDADVETLLYIALDDYQRKIESFDKTQKTATFKI